jgi:hypothetical protein
MTLSQTHLGEQERQQLEERNDFGEKSSKRGGAEPFRQNEQAGVEGLRQHGACSAARAGLTLLIILADSRYKHPIHLVELAGH